MERIIVLPKTRSTVLLYAIIIALLPCLLPAQELNAEPYVVVLLYHKFDEKDSPSTSIPSSLFAKQMAYLKANDYKVISTSELAMCIKGKKTFPEKAVVITIDDGYKSAYTKAIPILNEYGFPYTIFISTCAAGSRKCMSWDQLRYIRAHGGDVGCHSFTHPHMVDVSREEVVKELVHSKMVMEKKLGSSVRWFAYPFGEYDNYIRKVGLRAGYELMFTSDPGTIDRSSPPDALPRQAIVGSNVDMSMFEEKLERPPLHINACSPGPGRINGNSIDSIRIVLDKPRLFFPGQVQMFLSEKGRLNTLFNPKTGLLMCKGPIILHRKVNRIIVTARRKRDNKYAMHSYMIVLKQGKVLNRKGKAGKPRLIQVQGQEAKNRP